MQEGGLARSRRAGYDDHGRPGQPSRQLDHQVRSQPLTTVEHLGMGLVKGEQPQVWTSAGPARATRGVAATRKGLALPDSGQVLPGDAHIRRLAANHFAKRTELRALPVQAPLYFRRLMVA